MHITLGKTRRWLILGISLAWLIAPDPSLSRAGGDAQALPAQLAIVPQDGLAFIHVRPAELWASDLAVKLRKLYPDQAKFATDLGLDIADIDSVSIVLPTAQSILFLVEPRSKPNFKSGPVKKGDPKFDDFKKDPFEKKDPDKKPIDKDQPKPSESGKSEGSWAQDDVGSRVPAGMVILTTVKPLDLAKITQLVFRGLTVEEKHNDKTFLTSPTNKDVALCFLNQRTVVATSPASAMKTVLDSPEQTRPSGKFAAALELALKKRPVVVGLNLLEPITQNGIKSVASAMRSPYQRDPVWTLAPLLAMRSATLAVDVDKESRLSVQASLGFSDPERAAAAVGAVQDALDLARIFSAGQFSQRLRWAAEEEDNPLEPLFFSLLLKQADALVRGAVVERRLATVQVKAEGTLDVDALRAQAKALATAMVKDEASIDKRNRARSISNLKQLGLSFHFMQDVTGKFPPAAICDKDGKPLLSWRVAVLPYIGENALSNEFKRDEAWDSPHNIKLLARMPKVFAAPGVKTKEPYTTFYQVFTGAKTAFPQCQGISFFDLSRGSLNTFGIVEAFEPVPWTKPADLDYDPAKPLPKLGGIFKDGFHAQMMDASVFFFRHAEVDEKSLRSRIER